MVVWPTEVCCRKPASNHFKLRVLRVLVVSVEEKCIVKVCRCEMRRRVIEPMMTHRKPKIRHQKPAASKAGDQFTGCSEGRVSGVRCKVGAISFQAFLRNCGNQSSGCKGRNTNH